MTTSWRTVTRRGSLALLLALLPMLTYVDHIEIEVGFDIPGTSYAWAWPPGSAHHGTGHHHGAPGEAHDEHAEHARHCHDGAAGCASRTVTTLTPLAALAAEVDLLGCDGLVLACGTVGRTGAPAPALAPDTPPPRASVAL